MAIPELLRQNSDQLSVWGSNSALTKLGRVTTWVVEVDHLKGEWTIIGVISDYVSVLFFTDVVYHPLPLCHG